MSAYSRIGGTPEHMTPEHMTPEHMTHEHMTPEHMTPENLSTVRSESRDFLYAPQSDGML